MAKSRKKVSKQVQKIIHSDIFASIAIVSILFNVFFFSGIIVFSSTNEIDLSLHHATYDNLCEKNYDENIVEEMNNSTNPLLAQTLFEIQCQRGDFYRYYQNAVQAYLNDVL